MESDYECEIEESYDGALLDLDVQSIDGESISLKAANRSIYHKRLARSYGFDPRRS
jgi:phosphoribosyl-dephospho-CoA transferase